MIKKVQFYTIIFVKFKQYKPYQKEGNVRYKFKLQPYEHQLDALKKSWNKEYFALFMDMGTGKSKVLIDTMSILYDKGEICTAMIVAPKSVYRNWLKKEIPTHIPDHVDYTVVAWSPEKTKKT